jgi:hypothetical protein
MRAKTCSHGPATAGSSLPNAPPRLRTAMAWQAERGGYRPWRKLRVDHRSNGMPRFSCVQTNCVIRMPNG